MCQKCEEGILKSHYLKVNRFSVFLDIKNSSTIHEYDMLVVLDLNAPFYPKIYYGNISSTISCNASKTFSIIGDINMRSHILRYTRKRCL